MKWLFIFFMVCPLIGWSQIRVEPVLVHDTVELKKINNHFIITYKFDYFVKIFVLISYKEDFNSGNCTFLIN